MTVPGCDSRIVENREAERSEIEEMDITRESAGLWAISQGFGDQIARDDDEIVERASLR
ncbi:MAG TPA: hypothetical protein VF505_12285 [Thermoanaerobaculia bacterium]